MLLVCKPHSKVKSFPLTEDRTQKNPFVPLGSARHVNVVGTYLRRDMPPNRNFS
jgi:hypothetical protein